MYLRFAFRYVGFVNRLIADARQTTFVFFLSGMQRYVENCPAESGEIDRGECRGLRWKEKAGREMK
ncbi:MAG: hypothetical protein WA102_02055 [Candidatus Methanoperedens sp.]